MHFSLGASIRRGGYLPALSLGILVSSYIDYVWYEQVLFMGQPAYVVSVFATFTIALGIWLCTPRSTNASGLTRVFLVAMMGAWAIHVLLYRLHGDAMNYTAILYILILLMILLKSPDWVQIRSAVLMFAWTTTIILVLTRILEAVGIIMIKEQPQGVIEFDEERYFLPLNGLLGIDGRWPGPFGHNGDTAMMAALLVIIAVAFWTRASWVFLAVGVLVLTLTDGRASIGALVSGLITVWMFSNSRHLAWAPRWTRIVTGIAVLLTGALLMFLRPAGLTGRERIWPAFLELWWESPWIGVGGSGFAVGNEITQQFGHAHSLYIEELARSGLLGFVAQFIALGVGVFIAARAAQIGYPGPLAVAVTYFIAAITEPRNNWVEPSAVWFLLILMVLAASTQIAHVRPNKVDESESRLISGAPRA